VCRGKPATTTATTATTATTTAGLERGPDTGLLGERLRADSIRRDLHRHLSRIRGVIRRRPPRRRK
jgi:hypothetical protein